MENQEIRTKAEEQSEHNADYVQDEEYGVRLLIHSEADQRELSKNIIAARVILRCFPTTMIKIRAHRLEKGIKNPEYEIDGLLADRKGIESEKGIKWGFKSAKRQGCNAIVIDLNDKMRDKPLRARTIAKMINWRYRDFEQGIIRRCYIIYGEQSTMIDDSCTDNQQIIKRIIKMKP